MYAAGDGNASGVVGSSSSSFSSSSSLPGQQLIVLSFHFCPPLFMRWREKRVRVVGVVAALSFQRASPLAFVQKKEVTRVPAKPKTYLHLIPLIIPIENHPKILLADDISKV